MTVALERPLDRTRVEAANEIYRLYLPGWQLCDRALHALHDGLPGNMDLAHVLPKAVTLNQLYATRIFAIARVAEHVAAVLAREPDPTDLDVVERVAWMPGLGKTGMHLRSFASKYCHFFVSADRFPILDGFAGVALTHHLGRRGRSHYRREPFSYMTFVADVCRLREAAGLTCNYAETDRYLWLCGQWLRFREARRAGKPVQIGDEVRQLLRASDRHAKELLRVAFSG